MDLYYILFAKKNAGNNSAAINRIQLFSKGLREKEGVNVTIKIIDLTPFCSSILNRMIAPFLLMYHFFPFLLYIRNAKLIFYGESVAYRFFPILKKFNTIIVERTEFPTHMIRTDDISRELEKFCLSFLNSLKYADGFITCSNELASFYSNYLNEGTPVFISPLIVDVSLFSQYSDKIENRITYCGDWGNNKDGVEILIQAFALIHKKYPTLRLALIGGSTSLVEERLHKLVRNLRIESMVDFVGRIDHKLMPFYLSSSVLLALARPANKQAAGGIPSKVAEYLSTKRPVVLTNVGELYKFLHDGVNCYMCTPGSVDAFARKMDYALSDINSIEIGNRGYQTVLQFDYLVQSGLLYDFLK